MDIKNAESPVTYSPDWWRVTLSSIGDAVIVTDQGGKVAFMNAVAQNLTGWENDEGVHRPVEEVFCIVHEQSRQTLASPVREVLKTGSVVELSNHSILLTKSGLEYPVNDSAAPIKDEKGNILGVVLVFRDITDRKRADLTAHQLAAIVESSDDAIISQTLGGIITTWNRGAEKIYGYKASEVIGRPVSILIPPERTDEVPNMLERLKQREPVEHYETVRKTKEGRLIDVSLTLSPIFDGEGTLVGASKIARDITDRQRAESESSYLAAIVESSEDAIISKTLGSIITSWNKSAEELFGYSAEEAIGQNIALIIPLERHGEETEIIRTLQRGERLDHFETVRQRKDGKLLDISLTISPIRDRSGRIVGASKIARDISDRKRLEREREDLLQREHAARTKAEEANRIKDEFLATVSHELRTPLNAILGWATLLSDAKLDSETMERALAIIKRNAQTQSQIINDILDVSRIVSGRLRLNVSTLDLAPIIEMAVETVRPAAEAKGLKLLSSIDANIPRIFGDPDRLQQVVWNLLSNAIKFTPTGGQVEVRVRTLNRRVEISVSDTGQGISQEFLPHVFDRFRQADSSTTRLHGGLGLGLAIVHHLVELHGGTVRADSAGEGAGSTFTVQLQPAVAHRPGALRGDIGTVASENAPNLKGLTILVVDDEPDAREIISAMLEQYGADVKSAGSVSQAFDILLHGSPHVLVSDIGMPENDGYDLIRQVRSRGIQIPAVAVTAHAMSEDRLKALSAGYQVHVAKPVDSVELGIVVASLAGLAKRS